MCVVIAVFGWWFSTSHFNTIPNVISTMSSQATKQSFPTIETAQLDTSQQKIVTLLRQEYDAQAAGTKYADGSQEAWCADFVSWIMHESGTPLNNPNSGSWRIPGTYTLRDYYESAGMFKPYSSGYQPKVGDVVLYDNPGIFGQHTNIVIKNDHGILTTVGGNEPGGIRVFTNERPEAAGTVGYGVLK